MMRHRTEPVKPERHALAAAEVEAEAPDLPFLLWLSARAATEAIDAALHDVGLTGDEFAIYSILASAEGTSPSTLARWMAAPRTTVSSYVQRFERRGHVVRRPSTADRRSYELELTPAGRAVHARAVEAYTPFVTRLSATLGSSERGTHRALLALRSALDVQRPT